MVLKHRNIILVIGSDASLIYLLVRFAERGGYQLKVYREDLSVTEIAAIDPLVVIFLSVDHLARASAVLTELAGPDVPLLVCSSITEGPRATELGADYCLLHPLTYDDFQTTLANATALKKT